MRLKRKLGIKYASRNSPGIIGHDELYGIHMAMQEQAFIAGFDYARGMAILEYKQTSRRSLIERLHEMGEAQVQDEEEGKTV